MSPPISQSSQLYRDSLRKRRRKKTALKMSFIGLGAAGFVIFMIYLLFFAELFDVRALEIAGTKAIPKERIVSSSSLFLEQKNFLGLPAKMNIILLPKAKMESSILNEFSRLESVSVSRQLFHTLKIDIKEREIAGIWCFGKERCFYFDGNGVAFEEAPDSSGILILHVRDERERAINLSEEVESNFWLGKIIQAKNGLEEKAGIKTSSVNIAKDSYDEFEIITAERWKLILSSQLDVISQMESLKIFLSQKFPEKNDRRFLQYIDARIADRFYYK